MKAMKNRLIEDFKERDLFYDTLFSDVGVILAFHSPSQQE